MIAPSRERLERFESAKQQTQSKLARKAGARDVDLKKPQSYVLEVAIRVKPGAMDAFADLAEKILPLVNIPGLHLVAAGRCLDPDPRRVLHLWRLDSADLLREAMIRLSDVPAYGLLDAMVMEEVQEICTSLLGDRPKPKSELYVRMTGLLRTRELAEFVAQNEAGLGRFERDSGWRIAGALISVTGRVNRISLIWAVPSQDAAHDYATKVPGYRYILDPETEIWLGTAYDPPIDGSTTRSS